MNSAARAKRGLCHRTAAGQPTPPNSQILAEFQSVCAKSPGLESGRAQGSLSFELSLVFEVELRVKNGGVNWWHD